MSAEFLREAATMLRERAEGATPGPWVQVHSRHFGPQAAISTGISNLIIREQANEGAYIGAPNALYIATVHPAVGLALADWLIDAEQYFGHDTLIDQGALAVAAAILGRQP